MADHVPAPVRGIQVLMFALFAATLATPARFALWVAPEWFFYLLAVVFALPALPPLACALAARRPRKAVFAAVLLTAAGLILWAIAGSTALLQGFTVAPAALFQIPASIAVLVLVLLPSTRAFYLRS